MPDFIPPFSTRLTNRQVILARRPAASPVAADFARKDVSIASPDEGQFLVRNLYLAADPVQRGWAANEALTPLGQPMRALAVGVVVESRDDGIRSGDVVYGFFGWQDYKVATRGDLLSHIPHPRAPLSAYAGVLGMPGVTAWLALQDIAPPYEGAAMLVSTAAGTVGSVVGQIGQRAGAFVVGLTGSDEKVESCVRDYGYDVAYNYKSVDLAATLAEARPGGFNIYFDNTGGPILDTAIRAMARHGRIVHCGTAATPSWTPPADRPSQRARDIDARASLRRLRHLRSCRPLSRSRGKAERHGTERRPEVSRPCRTRYRSGQWGLGGAFCG